jgi:cytochrome b561/polyisoprenoid-binding protein YceI
VNTVRYSKIAMLLHWSLAFALAFQIGLGWQFVSLQRGPNLFELYQLHKSVGIMILVLSLARLVIRMGYTRPKPLADTIWSRRTAKLVHGGFYLVLIGGPLTGWLLVSSAKIAVPTVLFGILPLPHLPVGSAAHGAAEALHSQLAWLAIVLLLLHVIGALRHQFVKDEDILQRMLPWVLKRKTAAFATMCIILTTIGMAYGAGANLMLANAPKARSPAAQSPAKIPEATLPDTPKSAEEPKAVNKQDAGIPVKEWRVSGGGKLAFTVDWNGTPINGTFRRWNSDIRFSPEDLAQSRIRVTIDVGSASTADNQRDDMLLGESFLNAAAHPKAVFNSSSIRLLNGDHYSARGTLDMNGKAHPVTLSFKLKIDGTRAEVAGSSSLRRTQFGVGSGEWAETNEVADTVLITFDFTARAAQ